MLLIIFVNLLIKTKSALVRKQQTPPQVLLQMQTESTYN